MEYTTVKYTVDERGVAKVYLNRPSSLNSLDTQSFVEWLDVLKFLDLDPSVRCVIITGEGKGFCSGGDLAEMKAGFDGVQGFHEHMEYANIFTCQLAGLGKPVIALVNGAATGAGMNVALAADFVIASEKAKFGEVFANVGLAVDCGAAYLLPRLVGMAKAKELIYTARIIGAEEAKEIGLVYKVVAPEELDAAGDELAAKLAAGPTFAYALDKKMLGKSFESTIKDMQDLEQMCQALAGNSKDHKEGCAAFFEKRKPEFQGK